MATPFIGQIIIFGGNFAIRNYAFCNGQLLAISQNTALFSILGTTYGGNGTSNFALPDLQGRVPMHWGNGSGLTPRIVGEVGGSESVTLTTGQIPAHNHTNTAATTLKGSSSAANASSPSANVPGSTGRSNIYQSGTPDVNLNSSAAATSVTVNAAGGGLAHDNMPPFLAVTFLIALFGIFPSRS